jgi:hypothetical protein
MSHVYLKDAIRSTTTFAKLWYRQGRILKVKGASLFDLTPAVPIICPVWSGFTETLAVIRLLN